MSNDTKAELSHPHTHKQSRQKSKKKPTFPGKAPGEIRILVQLLVLISRNDFWFGVGLVAKMETKKHIH